MIEGHISNSRHIVRYYCGLTSCQQRTTGRLYYGITVVSRVKFGVLLINLDTRQGIAIAEQSSTHGSYATWNNNTCQLIARRERQVADTGQPREVFQLVEVRNVRAFEYCFQTAHGSGLSIVQFTVIICVPVLNTDRPNVGIDKVDIRFFRTHLRNGGEVLPSVSLFVCRLSIIRYGKLCRGKVTVLRQAESTLVEIKRFLNVGYDVRQGSTSLKGPIINTEKTLRQNYLLQITSLEDLFS